MTAKKVFSTSEAARVLGISIDAVQRLVLAGKLKARKIEDRWKISEKSLSSRLATRGRRKAA